MGNTDTKRTTNFGLSKQKREEYNAAMNGAFASDKNNRKEKKRGRKAASAPPSQPPVDEHGASLIAFAGKERKKMSLQDKMLEYAESNASVMKELTASISGIAKSMMT